MLNTKIIMADNEDLDRPCEELGYCPYGQLVKEFPISTTHHPSCQEQFKCFRSEHDCPVYYLGEEIEEKTGTEVHVDPYLIAFTHNSDNDLVQYCAWDFEEAAEYLAQNDIEEIRIQLQVGPIEDGRNGLSLREFKQVSQVIIEGVLERGKKVNKCPSILDNAE